MPSTYVYIYRDEGPVPAGLLETIGVGREATSHFAYGRRYLARKDRLALDPVQLPLHEAKEDREYVAPCFIAVNDPLENESDEGI